jgi:hypothetical protein
MRHQLRPKFDGLEDKTLLSSFAAGVSVHANAHLAEVRRDVEAPAISASLTTSQTTLNPGQVVQFRLALTNTSNHTVTIGLGPSVDGFYATHNGKVVWRSNNGLEPEFIVRRTLRPGQTITLSADWTVPASMTGTFVVHNQLFPTGPTATITVTTTPVHPAPVHPAPVSPTPVSPSPGRPSPVSPTPVLPGPIAPIPTPTSQSSAVTSPTPTPPTPIQPIIPVPTPPAPTPPTPILPIIPGPTPPGPIVPGQPGPISPDPRPQA